MSSGSWSARNGGGGGFSRSQLLISALFCAVTWEFCRSGLSSNRCSARSPMVLAAVDNDSVVAVYPPPLISAPFLRIASAEGFREHVGHGSHVGEPIELLQVDRHAVID